MKNIDSYVSTILTSELPEEVKITYLRNLNQIGNLTKEQMKELENKIYVIDNQTISEKDKLIYEANFLYMHYKSNNLDLSDIRRIYYKIRKSSHDENDIDKIKMYITQLQLEQGLGIRFYKSYIDLLEKMEKENRRKTQRTFHK